VYARAAFDLLPVEFLSRGKETHVALHGISFGEDLIVWRSVANAKRCMGGWARRGNFDLFQK